MKSFRLSRRQFLTWLTRGSLTTATALVIGQVIRFLSFRPAGENSSVIPVGRPEDYPRATLAYVPEARVYVGRDMVGLYALDAVCTHLGCLVERGKKGGFKCPCHGSRFDDDGQAKTGPATKPLRFLRLWLDEDGLLLVDRAQPVAPTVRLTV